MRSTDAVKLLENEIRVAKTWVGRIEDLERRQTNTKSKLAKIARSDCKVCCKARPACVRSFVPFVRSPVCPSVRRPRVRPSVRLPVCAFVRSSVRSSVRSRAVLFVRPCVRSAVRPSVRLCALLAVCPFKSPGGWPRERSRDRTDGWSKVLYIFILMSLTLRALRLGPWR